MKILILFTIILTGLSAGAAEEVAVMQDHFPEDHMDKAQTDMVKERMEAVEDKPASTSIGGSRSGQLDFEKKQDMEDTKSDHDMEKQKQLYEYEDKYRRGL